MTINDFAVGKAAYLLRNKGSINKYDDAPQEVQVSHIGRKYVTVKVGVWDHKFYAPEYDKKSEYFIEKMDYGTPDYLFPTMEAFRAWNERNELLDWFYKNRDRLTRYSTDQLRAARDALLQEEEQDKQQARGGFCL